MFSFFVQVNLSFSSSKIQLNLSFFFSRIGGESLLKVTSRKKVYKGHESPLRPFQLKERIFHTQEICESVRAELKTPLPTPHMEECFLLTLPNIEELKTPLPTPHMEECFLLTQPNIEELKTPLPTPHKEECFLLTLPNLEELKTPLPTPHMEECFLLTLPNIEAGHLPSALTLPGDLQPADPLQLVQVGQKAGARPEDDHVVGMEAEEPQEAHADQLPEAL
jgi:hypothetical protein